MRKINLEMLIMNFLQGKAAKLNAKHKIKMERYEQSRKQLLIQKKTKLAF